MFGIGINSNNECGSNIEEVCANVKKAVFNNIMIAFKVGDELLLKQTSHDVTATEKVKDVKGEDICFCLNCLYEHKLQIPMTFC